MFVFISLHFSILIVFPIDLSIRNFTGLHVHFIYCSAIFCVAPTAIDDFSFSTFDGTLDCAQDSTLDNRWKMYGTLDGLLVVNSTLHGILNNLSDGTLDGISDTTIDGRGPVFLNCEQICN